jgi:hypothetical protein
VGISLLLSLNCVMNTWCWFLCVNLCLIEFHVRPAACSNLGSCPCWMCSRKGKCLAWLLCLCAHFIYERCTWCLDLASLLKGQRTVCSTYNDGQMGFDLVIIPLMFLSLVCCVLLGPAFWGWFGDFIVPCSLHPLSPYRCLALTYVPDDSTINADIPHILEVFG